MDKIFKDAKPGELPVEDSMTITLAINRSAATMLGIAAAEELQLRAHKVIV